MLGLGFSFLLSLICQVADGRNLQIYCLAGASAGVRRATRLPELHNCGPPCVGLACLARCHARLHGSASPFSSGGPWLRPSRPLAAGHRCNNSRVVLLLLLVLRLDKASGSTLYWCHCVQYVLSCLTVQALFLCPLIILLGLADFPHIAPSLQTLWP